MAPQTRKLRSHNWQAPIACLSMEVRKALKLRSIDSRYLIRIGKVSLQLWRLMKSILEVSSTFKLSHNYTCSPLVYIGKRVHQWSSCTLSSSSEKALLRARAHRWLHLCKALSTLKMACPLFKAIRLKKVRARSSLLRIPSESWAIILHLLSNDLSFKWSKTRLISRIASSISRRARQFCQLFMQYQSWQWPLRAPIRRQHPKYWLHPKHSVWQLTRLRSTSTRNKTNRRSANL